MISADIENARVQLLFLDDFYAVLLQPIAKSNMLQLLKPPSPYCLLTIISH